MEKNITHAIYEIVGNDIQFLGFGTKETVLKIANVKDFNYNKPKALHDMRYNLVHANETHAIFKA